MTVAAILILLFFILLAVRLNKTDHYSTAVIFIPIWIFLSCATCCWVTCLSWMFCMISSNGFGYEDSPAYEHAEVHEDGKDKDLEHGDLNEKDKEETKEPVKIEEPPAYSDPNAID